MASVPASMAPEVTHTRTCTRQYTNTKWGLLQDQHLHWCHLKEQRGWSRGCRGGDSWYVKAKCECVCETGIREKAVIWEMSECYSRCSTLPLSLSSAFPLCSLQGSRFSPEKQTQERRKCFHLRGCRALVLGVFGVCQVRAVISNAAAICDKLSWGCASLSEGMPLTYMRHALRTVPVTHLAMFIRAQM